MGEFEFIQDLLADLAGPEGLGLQDDVAIWSPPRGQDAVITTDTIVEGVHFPAGKFDFELAQKLLRVSVSDLTAKGADPIGYFLSLSLPPWVKPADLEAFTDGLSNDQAWYGMSLWGGDTTSTKKTCVLSATMIGVVPKDKAVLRSRARVGELLCVSGTIGDAYLGLQSVMKVPAFDDLQTKDWEQAYHVPSPPFALRKAIQKHVSAAVDVSDGLLADAAHIATASGVGIDVFLSSVPASLPTRAWLLAQPDIQKARLALATGGDDYQTLLSVPQHMLIKLQKTFKAENIDLTVIGKVTDTEKLRCLDDLGREIEVESKGYQHF